MPNAPVVAFAYRRPDHVRRTLESLFANPEALASPLFVFCDGPRKESDAPAVKQTRATVRATVRKYGHSNATIVERERNLGLANSIIDGVGRLCAEFGRAIVVEDDLILAPMFLAFLNDALDRYQRDNRVFQISGHMFPVEIASKTDSFFLPFTTSWGWATWARAWRHFDPNATGLTGLRTDRALRRRFDLDASYPYFAMAERQARGEIDSWAIRWYLSVFIRGGLTLHPRRTLVTNIGFDGSGEHCGETQTLRAGALASTFVPRVLPPTVATDENAFREIRAHLRRQYPSWTRHLGYLRELIFSP